MDYRSRIGAFLDSTDKPISPLGKRFDQARGFGIVPERFAQFLHRVIQALIEVDEGVGGPDSPLQLFAGHNVTGALKQCAQELERLNLQFDPEAVAMQFARPEPDFEITEANDFLCGCVHGRLSCQLVLELAERPGPNNRRLFCPKTAAKSIAYALICGTGKEQRQEIDPLRGR
jgi:hypothetical protein